MCLVAGDKEPQPVATKRSITEVRRQRAASSSPPTVAQKAASLEVANKKALARDGLVGDSPPTSALAKRAAACVTPGWGVAIDQVGDRIARNGKTVTRYLSEGEASSYGQWFDNAKQLRLLLAELEGLGLQILESRNASAAAPRADVGARRLSRG